MELGDHVKTSSRRLFAAFVAIVAAVATGVVLSLQPSTYGASVEFDVPAASAGSVGGLSLYLANFRTALTSSSVEKAVADKLDVSRSSISGGQSVSQIGQSTSLRVKMVHEDRALAASAADAYAREAAASVARRDVTGAQQQVDAGRVLYDNASRELNEFQRNHGTIEGSPHYQGIERSVNELQLQIDAATRAGDNGRVTALQSQLAPQFDELVTLNELAREEGGLKKSADDALNAWNQARRAQTSAQTGVDRTQTQTFLSNPSTSVQSKTKPVAQAAILAALVGGGLVLVFFTLADLLVGRLVGRRRHAAAGQSVDLTSTQATGAPEAHGVDAPASPVVATNGANPESKDLARS